MEHDFWLERWERAEIGFHQGETTPYLLQYWPTLQLPQGSEVFVPLCGKSLDMVWLRQQQHAVLGVELSPLAVQAFFTENGYATQATRHDAFDLCAADEIRILCGDFFALRSEDVAHVKAVFDRAALVALPAEMRARYVAHLLEILPPATQILLVTFDYPQHQMSGPPFAVSAAEVESLYGQHATIKKLSEVDIFTQNPRFRERGLSQIHEQVFLLTLNKNEDEQGMD